MNLLADEGVDRAIVERLRNDGHEVLYVAEFSPSITDDGVLQQANNRSALLVTSDKDFGELVFRQGRAHPGVVLLWQACRTRRRRKSWPRSAEIGHPSFPRRSA